MENHLEEEIVVHSDISYYRLYRQTTALPHDIQLPLDVIAFAVSSSTVTIYGCMDRVTDYVQHVKNKKYHSSSTIERSNQELASANWRFCCDSIN